MIFFGSKKTENKSYLPITDYPVEPVFEIAGKKFFQFVDASNIPAGRFLAAMKWYIPLKTNCDDVFLKSYLKAQEAVLNDPKSISIDKLVTLKNMLKDRLEWIFTPELVMKYASVVYMAEDESPFTFDEDYSDKKIDFWKQNTSAEDFFLSQPIIKLVPHLKSAAGFVPSYLVMTKQAEILQYQKLSEILSQSPKLAADVSNINLLISQLQKRKCFEGNQLMNTSFSSNSNIPSLKRKLNNGKK